MALTILQTVNLVLRENAIIVTDLTALTSQSQQGDVEAAIASINETYDELAALCQLPSEVAEGTFTLVTGDRDYAVASDFKAFADDGVEGGPMFVCESVGHVLMAYPGGFMALRETQLQPDSETGSPTYWVPDPTDGEIYLDKIPTAAENGRVYRYMYEKHESFTNASAASTFAYLPDPAIKMAVPAMAQLADRKRRNRFDRDIWQMSISKTAGILTRLPRRTRYGN